MPRKSLLAAGIVFAGLLVLTWWVRRPPVRTEPRPYFTLKARTPDTVMVAYGPDTTVLVPGGETGWQVVAPGDYPADGLLIEAILNRLRELEVKAVYPMTREKLDSYGLRHPRGTIRAAYADGREPDTLILGGFTPDGAFDYVRAGSGSDVALVESRITRSYFLKATRELRETRLLPFRETQARRFELLGPEGAVRAAVEKDDAGRWRVTAPHPGPADAGESGEYLTSLNHMHIRDFVPGNTAAWAVAGLEHPALGVSVTTDDGSRYGAYLGGAGPDGTVYARGPVDPQVFLVPDTYVAVLERSADTFRRTAAVTFGLNQVDSVRVSAGGKDLVVDLGPPAGDEPPSATRDVLGNWLLLRAEGFEPAGDGRLERRGLSPPAGRLVWRGGPDTLAVVDVGVARDGRLPVRVVHGPEKRPEEILLFSSDRAVPLWSYLQRQVAQAGT
jgi:hypothetical protein